MLKSAYMASSAVEMELMVNMKVAARCNDCFEG